MATSTRSKLIKEASMSSSLDGSTQFLILLVVLLATFGPFLIRRMLNPLENAASKAYAKKDNERESNKVDYLANYYGGHLA